MTVFVIRRLMQAFFVVFLMSVIVFFGVNIVGDPVYMLVSPDADQADIEAAIRRLGLDRPVWEQYWTFLINLAEGDLGRSFVFNEPALKLILQRLPATLELAFVAMLISIFVGIPLGIWAGFHPNSVSGRGIMAGSIVGFSLPNFWQGLMLIMIFAVMLGWLPAGGRGDQGEFLVIADQRIAERDRLHVDRLGLPSIRPRIGPVVEVEDDPRPGGPRGRHPG